MEKTQLMDLNMTKNKMDLNIRKMTNHPPSPVALGNREMIVEAARQCAKDRKEWRALVHM